MTTWLENHRVSERHAQLAEVALRQGHSEEAQNHYLKAAEAELLALRSLTPEKQKTLGVTVVSAVALSVKAEDWRLAERVACEWLAKDGLPLFAIAQLRQMLVEIWQQYPVSLAAVG
jgi:hypothetical protein